MISDERGDLRAAGAVPPLPGRAVGCVVPLLSIGFDAGSAASERMTFLETKIDRLSGGIGGLLVRY